MKRQRKRATFLEHFAHRELCLIGMETCGGALVTTITRDVPPGQTDAGEVRQGFRDEQKNGSADASAIWMATQMPSKAVAVKTEAQQAVLALHPLPQQKIKLQTAQNTAR